MKALLIRPRPHKETIGLQNVMICEPLELEYIASNIEELVDEVEILDMIIEKKEIQYYIKKIKPDIVCLTGYIVHVNIIKQYAKAVKSINPQIVVIAGGVHAEVVPEDFEDDNIDYIIRANPLKTIREIILNIQKEKELVHPIEGIYDPTKERCEKETTFCYRKPDREKVAKYRKKYYYMFHNPCALIKTSFGCPYDCSFCFCKEVTDGKYFTRELEDVIEELKSIPEREVYIVDDDFLANRNRILKFCELLTVHKIDKKFLVYGRADFISNNADVIEKFAQCGLRAVIVGLESCNIEELNQYNKHSDVYINESAVAILNKNQIECYGTFILGIDWTKKEFINLEKWIKKLGIMFINLQPLTPLPGTAIYKEYENKFIIRRDEYEKWDLAHLVLKPTGMTIRRYYYNMIKIYYKITMSPKNIIKSIKNYGLKENIKLSIGSTAVTWQYIKKIIRG